MTVVSALKRKIGSFPAGVPKWPKDLLKLIKKGVKI